MAIIIFTLVLGILYLAAMLITKVIYGKIDGKKTFLFWLIFSFIAVFSYGMLVTANARWAEKKCAEESGYNITKTVEADGFFAHSTSSYDFLPYIVKGHYQYIELLNFKGKRFKRVYLTDINNINCQKDYFERNNMGMRSLLRNLPSPPIPEDMCVAIEFTEKSKSRYKFEKGNIKWISGKGTTVHKVIDTANGDVISTWTGFVGRSYFKTHSCTNPQNGKLFERTIMLNKSIQPTLSALAD